MPIILERAEAAEQCEYWRTEGARIVFTNGVFDILHRGHVEYLDEAAGMGDRLVVGVNDDDSARRLKKGPARPFNTAGDRMALLAALRFVDLVVPFSEDTPLELIEALRPDILVKGGDYALDEIVGVEEVMRGGGEVRSISLREGYSTTSLVERLRQEANQGHGD